ncbi:MAG: UDP-N-acetylmuramate--L-alanine ligase [Muribaculaceae bacterium]|nr:UDP-N-acetylmuramate--L-alanine ligase [Muribaculaceae bacterium]
MEKNRLYFVGAGGIGMANLVRYFLRNGAEIAGYDRTATALTDKLIEEGASLVFDDDENLIPESFRDPEKTLVVYTPAVSEENRILSYFRRGGFEIIKRAALLGKITRQSKAICVAGSHGKTTTSSMIAHILSRTPQGCNAFLGGILRNTNSNLMLSQQSPYSVIEADEYDRSFHHLSPFVAVVTSVDPDHLDIYGDEEGYLEGFAHFTSLIRPGGELIIHTGLKLHPRLASGVGMTTYSGGADGDWHTENVRYSTGKVTYDIVGPDGIEIRDISPVLPIEINIDNGVAAAAAAYKAGATPDEIRSGLETFLGAERRFQIYLNGLTNPDGHVLIDDYAHSPNEVKASIESVRRLYPDRHLSVIFQPHLYTRTRDFAPEFAEALSAADRVIMPEIYPARELPIEGVDSMLILNSVKSGEKIYCERKNLLNLIKNSNFDVLMTLGAADINVLVPEIEEILRTTH